MSLDEPVSRGRVEELSDQRQTEPRIDVETEASVDRRGDGDTAVPVEELDVATLPDSLQCSTPARRVEPLAHTLVIPSHVDRTADVGRHNATEDVSGPLSGLRPRWRPVCLTAGQRRPERPEASGGTLSLDLRFERRRSSTEPDAKSVVGLVWRTRHRRSLDQLLAEVAHDHPSSSASLSLSTPRDWLRIDRSTSSSADKNASGCSWR